MYGHVITKFSRMASLPHFLTYGTLLSKCVRPFAAIMNHFRIPLSLFFKASLTKFETFVMVISSTFNLNED